jgi:hypothetical protein
VTGLVGFVVLVVVVVVMIGGTRGRGELLPKLFLLGETVPDMKFNKP